MANKIAFYSADQRLYPSDATLNGRLVTAVDPILIGDNDFQTLTNMRYTDTHVKAIPGMTKINTDAATFPNIKDAFYFFKEKYAEHHLVAQAYNAGSTLLNITEMTNAVPATGNFSATVLKNLVVLWTVNTAKVVGDFVFPTVSNGFYYECVTAGTTHAATQPTWSTTENTLQTDGTVVWMARAGDASGTFGISPNGNLVYCNGRENYIYSGNETEVGAFISINPSDETDIQDYTEIINNSYADSNNIVTIPVYGGGIDAYTMGHWSYDNAYTDDSGKNHTMTNVGCSFTTNSDKLLMGTHSLYGVTAYTSRDITGDADFDLTGGIFTVSFRLRAESVAASRGLFMFYKDSGTWLGIGVDANGSLSLQMTDDAGAHLLGTAGLATPNNTIIVNQKHTIEFSRDASHNWYIFVDGNLKATVNDTSVPVADYVGMYHGTSTSHTYAFHGTMDEVKVDVGICRHTVGYIPNSAAYSATGVTSIYIASPQCLDRIKCYVKTINTTAAAAAVYYWNGTAWTAVSSLVDGTSVGGESLAATGTLTWSSIETVSKQKIINNNLAYWIKVDFGNIDHTTTLYKVTNGFSFQKIRNAWDGEELYIQSFMQYTTTFKDYTINTLEEDYISADTGTYASIGGMTSIQYVIVGFQQRVLGLKPIFITDKVNTTAATVLDVKYYNGTTWVSVFGLTDGTSNNSISFAQNGTISWNMIDKINEKLYTPNNDTPLYYYKLSFDKTLSADVYIDLITGIPVQEDITGYTVPIKWLNSIFLCGEKYGHGNKIIGSEISTDSIFTGYNSFEGYLGDTDNILAGCTLYARYSSALHETLLLMKQNSTWLLDGSSFENIVSYQISNIYGILSPKTLKVCDLGYEIADGINKAVAIWQTNTCIVMFDNNSIIEISQDINNIFTDMYNTSKTDRINYLYSNKCTSFYDPIYKEYHFLYCANTSAVINAEYVFDITRKKWYFVDRSTKDLQCGLNVHDTKGNKYSYGILSTGFVERLDYGTSFDGDTIVCTLRTPDKPIGETIEYEDRIRQVKIIGKVSDSASTVSVTHYSDTDTTGETLNSITQSGTIKKVNLANRRVYQHKDQLNHNANLHSIKLVCSASDSQCCFEPLVISYLKKSTRNDLR
jgi:hypothetical protein